MPGISIIIPKRQNNPRTQLIKFLITAANVPGSAQINQKIAVQINHNTHIPSDKKVNTIHTFFKVGLFSTTFFSISLFTRIKNINETI